MVIPHIAAQCEKAADDAKAPDQQLRTRPPTRSTHEMTSIAFDVLAFVIIIPTYNKSSNAVV